VPVVLETTAAASGTATIIAVEADGTVVDTGVPSSTGFVTATLPIGDETVLRGDGGVRGAQESLVTIGDSGNVAGVRDLEAESINAQVQNSSTLGIGFNAMKSDVGGNLSTGVGYQALEYNSTGNSNTGFGALTMNNVTTNNDNTAIGTYALWKLLTGDNNTVLGSKAGRYFGVTSDLTTVSNSIYIGTDVKASANCITNEIAIGFEAVGQGSNTISFGNTSITDTYMEGNVHLDTGDDLLWTGGGGLQGAAITIDRIWGGLVIGAPQIPVLDSGSIAWGVSTDQDTFPLTASGQGSAAFNRNTSATGDYAMATGYGSASQGIGAFSNGFYSVAVENASSAFGTVTKANGVNEMVFGRYNTDYTFTGDTGSHDVDPTDRVLTIGVGESGAKADGMIMLFNGETTLPSTSIADIDSAGDKAIITREYLQETATLKTTISLSAAQINNIGTTPVQILPSPGVGKYIKVLFVDAWLNWGSVAFDTNDLKIETVGASNSQIIINSVLDQTADMNRTKSILASTNLFIANTAVNVEGTDSVAVGDSTIDLYITYEIITL